MAWKDNLATIAFVAAVFSKLSCASQGRQVGVQERGKHKYIVALKTKTV